MARKTSEDRRYRSRGAPILAAVIIGVLVVVVLLILVLIYRGGTT